MMPLWTSARVPPQSVCGCALTVLGAPCVAQRVWAIPVCPAGRLVPRAFSSTLIFPAALWTSMRPSSISASPAESYPRYSRRRSPRAGALPPAAAPCSLRCRTYASCLVHEFLGSPPSLGAGRRLGDQPDDRLGVRRSHVEPAVPPRETKTILRVDARVRKEVAQCRIHVFQSSFRGPRSAFRLCLNDRV